MFIRRINVHLASDRKLLWEFVADVIKNYDITDMPKHVQTYIDNKWLGYGVFIHKVGIETLIAYCFIKRPIEHPETTTVELEQHRGQGISYRIRDYAMQDAIANKLLVGDTIYSGTHKNNIESLVSVLRSGFKIISMNTDGFINLERKF